MSILSLYDVYLPVIHHHIEKETSERQTKVTIHINKLE